MDDKRKGRLHHYFQQVLEGQIVIQTAPNAKRFLEAVCSEGDSVACIERILSSKNGVTAIKQSIRIDVTVPFFNSSISNFLQYLQNPDIAVACGGELLHTVLQHIIDPPTFWNFLCNYAEAEALDSATLYSFAWMLLRLLSNPNLEPSPFTAIASKLKLRHVLSESDQVETRNLYHKIQQTIRSLENSISDTNNGPGGRHDNDFTDFRKISLLPSIDELVCTERPYLRLASEIEAITVENRLTAHMDNQFRLLREDMIRDLREEFTGQSKRQTQKIEHLKLVGAAVDFDQEWALEFACLRGLPFLSKQKDAGSRRDFLKKYKKILSHGALVCIFAGGVIVGFGTIWRQEDKLSEDIPLLHVRLPSNEAVVRRTLKGIRGDPPIEILSLQTAVFAYEPILQQLQNARRLPLAESITGWNSTQTITKIPLSPRIQQLVHELEFDPSTQLQDLLSLTKPTKLEQCQASSLVAGLSQQVALIQGPPGTGKSFIGALIAKALHKYTGQKILVLSYTNHALDQYLEDLINVGIPTSNIVRLGSSFKASVTTKPLILIEQAKSKRYNLKRCDWDLIESYRVLADDIGKRFVSAFADYTETTAKKQDIMDYLEFSEEFQDFFDAFQLPQDQQFSIVDNKGKAAGPHYLLDRWMRNEGVGRAINDFSYYPQVWALSLDERNRLRKRWLDDILGERLKRVVDYGQQYNYQISASRKVRGENGRRLMKDIRIIGSTTTAAAKMVTEIQSVQPEIVIVEEAGEILESHILAALGPETKQLILIGDHKQLRPKSHYDLSVEKGTGYDLNRSLFERLVLKGYPHQKLSQQHRMRPEISALVRALTYPELTDAPSTQGRASMRGFQDNIVFVNHTALEIQGNQSYDPREGSVSSSKTNNFEAQMTLKCVKYIAQQGYRSDQIVVLTPYLGQLRLLFDVLQTENDPVLNDLDYYDLVRAGLLPAATAKASGTTLRISTIDNYQGEESDIVVVSLTRSNERGDIGFLSSPERLNVLVSRARDGIIFIGNTSTFLKARSGKDLWSKFLGLLLDGHHIYGGFPVRCEIHTSKKAELVTPEDFDKLCPDGGCDAPCGIKLGCGVHLCPLRCHQLLDHTKMKCTYIVTDTCSSGHKLSWKCSDQRPASCRTCDSRKKRDEEKSRKEHDRLVAEALQKQKYDAKIAELDTQIELERQRLRDLKVQDEQEHSLKQKLADLHRARDNTKKARNVQTSSQAQHGNRKKSGRAATTSDQQDFINPAKQDCTSRTLPVTSQAVQIWNSLKSFDGVTNDAIDELMQLTGLESVKDWVLKMFQKLQTAQRQGIDITQERLGTVFLGNPGTGKTTVARLCAKFFAEVGVISNAKLIETTGAKLANEGVAGAKKQLESLLESGGGAFFIDEAYQLVSGNSYGGSAVLDFLLAEIENTVGKIVFMFAGYEKQMEKFFQHNPGLGSRMPHQLKFSDYSEAELLHMLGKKIETKFQGRMQVEGGLAGLYMRIVVRRLHRLSGQEGFGNARALENELARITSAQSVRLGRERLAGLGPNDFQLCKEDIIGPEPSGALVNSTAWHKLKSMIGLDSVKSSVKILLDRLMENYRRELKEQPPLEVSLNRLFVGSPGTGKTTVAKLYGQILADLGMLSSSECVIKTPADFLGSVLGESEKNTKAILDNTKGKILVIDEAYMLSSTSSKGDIYRTAVIDTIVSEVHSVPGEDRAVLLLGYEDQMKEMLRTVNPGLARRFPIENAFHFEDYNDQHLMAILNHKLVAQGLNATTEGKDTAINLLAKLRRRPNFGNAGEVENLLSRAKDNYSRRSRTPAEAPSDDIVFQPMDFDPDFHRSTNAVQDCRNLFQDIVGSEDLVSKLIGYIQSFLNAGEIGIDPIEVLPFNFVFKGPPGTGKTTTARKIGTVFYNMGFLSCDKVIECSATDLIGEYVGQTGPKVVQKFDEALGQVLFVDEAYRLGEGHFAKEAVDEVVDCLTKEKYKGKMLVIFAGYEGEINRLLKVNPGLSSRFPEDVMFYNLTPTLCIDLLYQKLRKNAKITLDLDMASDQKVVAADLFTRLMKLSGWANGRDVETIASRTIATVLKGLKAAGAAFKIMWSDVVTELDRMYSERKKRAAEVIGPLSDGNLSKLPIQSDHFPLSSPPSHTTDTVSDPSKSIAPVVTQEIVEESPSISAEACSRDPDVSDAIWQQLQADHALDHQQKVMRDEAINKAEADQAALAKKNSDLTALAKALEQQADIDEAVRRKWEEARLKELEAKRKADEEALRIRKLMEERERARQEDQKAQAKLRQMGVCVAGYRWIKQGDGYRCAGGSHFVTNTELGM